MPLNFKPALRNKALLTVLGLALVVAAFSEYARYLSQQDSSAPNTHGPLQLSFLGPSEQPDPALAAHPYPRALLISSSPGFPDSGIENDKIVRLVNTGHSVLTMNGYNPTAPWYGIQVKRLGTWTDEPMTFALSGPGNTTLNPGQSLEFPIIVPQGTEPWRVWLVYEEVPRSNLFTHAWISIKATFHLSQQTKPKFFVVQSDEIPR